MLDARPARFGRADFDKNSIVGAIEYINSYARDMRHWKQFHR